MRQAHSKRSRNRGRKVSNNPNRTFDSSGPDVKIRGSASQIFEKYQALARDASSSGDYIAAENFYQHAEHYFRVLAANAATNGAGTQAANGAAREASGNSPADGGRQPQAHGPNGGSRGNGRGRRNVGSVRPNGDGQAAPKDPGAGPQPVVPAPEGEQPQPQSQQQSQQQTSDTAGS